MEWNVPDHARRIAGRDHPRRDRFGDDTARSDHRVSADAHALEDLDAVAHKHVLPELDRRHLRSPTATAGRVEIVEVAVENLDAGADQRVCADTDARPFALDEGVVVDLGTLAEFDYRLRRGCLDVAVAAVELHRSGPAELDVAANDDRAVAEQQDGLQYHRGAAHTLTRG